MNPDIEELEHRLAQCRQTIARLAAVLRPDWVSHDDIIRAAESLSADLATVSADLDLAVQRGARLVVERDALEAAGRLAMTLECEACGDGVQPASGLGWIDGERVTCACGARLSVTVEDGETAYAKAGEP